jgi:hypothetical protein
MKSNSKNTHDALVSAPESAEDDSTGLVRKDAVARAAKVCSRTIDNLQRKKMIPYIKLSARCIRYHIPSVLRALKKFEVKEVS